MAACAGGSGSAAGLIATWQSTTVGNKISKENALTSLDLVGGVLSREIRELSAWWMVPLPGYGFIWEVCYGPLFCFLALSIVIWQLLLHNNVRVLLKYEPFLITVFLCYKNWALVSDYYRTQSLLFACCKGEKNITTTGKERQCREM